MTSFTSPITLNHWLTSSSSCNNNKLIQWSLIPCHPCKSCWISSPVHSNPRPSSSNSHHQNIILTSSPSVPTNPIQQQTVWASRIRWIPDFPLHSELLLAGSLNHVLPQTNRSVGSVLRVHSARNCWQGRTWTRLFVPNSVSLSIRKFTSFTQDFESGSGYHPLCYLVGREVWFSVANAARWLVDSCAVLYLWWVGPKWWNYDNSLVGTA